MGSSCVQTQRPQKKDSQLDSIPSIQIKTQYKEKLTNERSEFSTWQDFSIAEEDDNSLKIQQIIHPSCKKGNLYLENESAEQILSFKKKLLMFDKDNKLVIDPQQLELINKYQPQYQNIQDDNQIKDSQSSVQISLLNNIEALLDFEMEQTKINFSIVEQDNIFSSFQKNYDTKKKEHQEKSLKSILKNKESAIQKKSYQVQFKRIQAQNVLSNVFLIQK